jgi:hypothetical protein
MIRFYQFISELTIIQGVLFFTPVLLLMVLMPFYRIIFNVIRLTISGEKPEIINFEILFSPLISEKENILGGVEPNQIVSGSQATLYWQVKGASRVDLFPVAKDLRGNSTSVLITENNRDFTLSVHGLSGTVSQTLSIPAENIKSLETHKISDNEIISQSYIYPVTASVIVKNKRLLTKNIEKCLIEIKRTKLPLNKKLTPYRKKESPIFSANPSLSKYNQILTEQNRDKS